MLSLQMLLDTGKDEQKENFDVLVHNGDSVEGKSVGLMSCGKLEWI
ncbi:MAG: hypothetical protein HGA71_07745 [Azonexaceae bacterium]|nr:hypothetical protein [Azonexaceae bacterium]